MIRGRRAALLVFGLGAIAAGVAALIQTRRADVERRRAIEASAIPLDCAHVHVQPAAACAASPPILKDVVAAANLLSVGPGHCAPIVGREDIERSVAPSLAALGRVPLDDLTPRERVVAQNAALRIASCLLDGGRAPPTPVETAATKLVRHLALPAPVLDALGHAPDEVERWLGPSAAWTDRDPIVRPLQHEGGYGLTRAFRPVFYGPSAALFSQLVAVDDAGVPRVTSIAGEIEARSPAVGSPERACVVKLDPERLRCDTGALRAVHLEELPPSSFVFRAGSGVGCRSCHASGPFLTRDGGGGLPERRAALLERLRERLDLLRQRASP